MLALSMVVGITGAWFTASTAANKGDSGEIGFGKVALNASGDVAISTTVKDISLTVDKDQWTIAGGTVTNASDVAIYYAYVVSVDLYTDQAGEHVVSDATIRSYFTGLQAETINSGFLAGGSAEISGASVAATPVVFDSNGAFNDSNNTYYLVAKLQCYAVQARNMTAEALPGQLGNLIDATTAASLISTYGSNAAVNPDAE